MARTSSSPDKLTGAKRCSETGGRDSLTGVEVFSGFQGSIGRAPCVQSSYPLPEFKKYLNQSHELAPRGVVTYPPSEAMPASRAREPQRQPSSHFPYGPGPRDPHLRPVMPSLRPRRELAGERPPNKPPHGNVCLQQESQQVLVLSQLFYKTGKQIGLNTLHFSRHLAHQPVC